MSLVQALEELQMSILREGGDGDIYVQVTERTFNIICKEVNTYTKYLAKREDGYDMVTRHSLTINASYGKIDVSKI